VGTSSSEHSGWSGTELRFQAWQYDLRIGLFGLFFLAMTVLALVTAETTGGQLAGGLFMGAGLVLCVMAWANSGSIRRCCSSTPRPSPAGTGAGPMPPRSTRPPRPTSP
jgi:hypothetical protein